MEHKINLLLFIKISTFILLICICHFYYDVSTYSKYLVEFYSYRRKLYTRNYRLLVKYKQYKDSSTVCLREEIQNSGIKKKEDKYYNDKERLEKNKQSNGSLSKISGGHKLAIRNRSCIFETKKYSFLEKKIFKELDYEDFLKNTRSISEKLYKKIIRKKCISRFSVPLLLLLLTTTIPMLHLSLIKIFSETDGLLWLFGLKFSSLLSSIKGFSTSWLDISWLSLSSLTKETLSSIINVLIYALPFIILGVICVYLTIFYHKKVKKYEKLKFRKR
ncbi:uncharacterized protein MKS88_000154 [Plasmodium brasilianum]|uniref:uncharacterized protein n=1 Tax=Plasmodium brasilianum TaxID=5824 RepID=UPI00350E407C|nr:hypothetical protein MKS88_000154 [Plasmodium brasilianum]